MGQSYWGNGRNRAQVQFMLIKAVSGGREPHVLAYLGNQVRVYFRFLMHRWHHAAPVKSVANILTDSFWKGSDWQYGMKEEAVISSKMMCAFLLLRR